MTRFVKRFFLFFHSLILLLFSPLTATSVKTIHESLDPNSITQHLAFYTLYQHTHEGSLAIEELCKLLDISYVPHEISATTLQDTLEGLVSLVNPWQHSNKIVFPEAKLSSLSSLGKNLKNRSLQGYYVETEEAVLALPSEEIDITRGVLLAQLGKEKISQIKTYEALLDVMALQILARSPQGFLTPPKDLIRTINDFVFSELKFKFPPHSQYEDSIDSFTFLSSVLESRKGVCLGVSILYLALAQRLGLPLEIVTPPGHIYVRYITSDDCINIETTARGVHINSDDYLNINTCALQVRPLKEVIGLAFFNQASLFLSKQQYADALHTYKKAKKYLPNDPLLNELLAYQYLFTNNESEGKALLLSLPAESPFCIHDDKVREDFLAKKVDAEGIKALFQHVDENRESLLGKKDALEKAVDHYPLFRAGWFSLALTWLQLHRQREALEIFKKLIEIDSENPSAEYYLALLNFSRMDYSNAKKHLDRALTLVQKRNYTPECLKELQRELLQLFP